MLKKVATVPDLLINAPKHQEAKMLGVEHFSKWNDTNNVRDEFKGKSCEEIKNTLKFKANNFSVMCENVVGDYNISCVMRSANNFNAKEIFYVGERKFDKRGCCGIQNYNDIHWLPTIEDVVNLKEKYTLIAIDNLPGAISLIDYNWKKLSKPPLVVFGSEGVGITPTMRNLCEETIFIPEFGSVRSLNIAVAAGIVMYDIINKFNF